MNTPDPSPPRVQSQPPPKPPHDPAKGSLAAGVGWFFACLFGGGIALFVLMALVAQWNGLAGFAVSMAGLLPLGLVAVVAAWHGANGRTRTMLGMLLGLGIVVALGLLLVAACFGLIVAGGGLGNMH